MVAQDLGYDLATLEFSGGRLMAPAIDALVGDAVRVRIRARDISIALSRPADISVLNVLEGRIIDIHAQQDAGAAVRVAIGGSVLTARITRYSAERLQLAAGRDVFVLIKAVSLM